MPARSDAGWIIRNTMNPSSSELVFACYTYLLRSSSGDAWCFAPTIIQHSQAPQPSAIPIEPHEEASTDIAASYMCHHIIDMSRGEGGGGFHTTKSYLYKISDTFFYVSRSSKKKYRWTFVRLLNLSEAGLLLQCMLSVSAQSIVCN